MLRRNERVYILEYIVSAVSPNCFHKINTRLIKLVFVISLFHFLSFWYIVSSILRVPYVILLLRVYCIFFVFPPIVSCLCVSGVHLFSTLAFCCPVQSVRVLWLRNVTSLFKSIGFHLSVCVCIFIVSCNPYYKRIFTYVAAKIYLMVNGVHSRN